jgi:hypothetical protein
MRRHLSLLALCAFLFPLTVEAAQETLWNFRGGQVPGQWTVNNWGEVTPTADGLLIKAAEDGSMKRPADLPFLPQTITFLFGNAPPTSAVFYWHRRGMPELEIIQLPFAINADGGSTETVHIDLRRYEEWNEDVDAIGFGLPKGTQIVLKEIGLYRWSLAEQATEAWKTFWTFDDYQPYSINFLWGPQLVYDRFSRAVVFDSLPPMSNSGTRVLYVILGLAGAGILVHRFMTRRSTGHLRWFLFTFAALWLLFDVRMGAELLSYARTDYRTYIGKSGPQRELRALLNSHAVAEAALARIPDPEYGLIMPGGTGIPALFHYLGYPRRPITDRTPNPALRYWLVFKDDKTTINEKKELVVDGTVVSGPGTIVEQYESTSYLFEATP